MKQRLFSLQAISLIILFFNQMKSVCVVSKENSNRTISKIQQTFHFPYNFLTFFSFRSIPFRCHVAQLKFYTLTIRLFSVPTLLSLFFLSLFSAFLISSAFAVPSHRPFLLAFIHSLLFFLLDVDVIFFSPLVIFSLPSCFPFLFVSLCNASSNPTLFHSTDPFSSSFFRSLIFSRFVSTFLFFPYFLSLFSFLYSYYSLTCALFYVIPFHFFIYFLFFVVFFFFFTFRPSLFAVYSFSSLFVFFFSLFRCYYSLSFQFLFFPFSISLCYLFLPRFL